LDFFWYLGFVKEVNVQSRFFQVFSQPWVKGLEGFSAKFQGDFQGVQLHSVKLSRHGAEGFISLLFDPEEDSSHQSLKLRFVGGLSIE
jgi:hypothetical protein